MSLCLPREGCLQRLTCPPLSWARRGLRSLPAASGGLGGVAVRGGKPQRPQSASKSGTAPSASWPAVHVRRAGAVRVRVPEDDWACKCSARDACNGSRALLTPGRGLRSLPLACARGHAGGRGPGANRSVGRGQGRQAARRRRQALRACGVPTNKPARRLEHDATRLCSVHGPATLSALLPPGSLRATLTLLRLRARGCVLPASVARRRRCVGAARMVRGLGSRPAAKV